MLAEGDGRDVGRNALHLDQSEVALPYRACARDREWRAPLVIFSPSFCGLKTTGDLLGVAHDMRVGQQHAGPAVADERLSVTACLAVDPHGDNCMLADAPTCFGKLDATQLSAQIEGWPSPRT